MPLTGRGLGELADVEHLEDRHTDAAKGRAGREEATGKVVSSPRLSQSRQPHARLDSHYSRTEKRHVARHIESL